MDRGAWWLQSMEWQSQTQLSAYICMYERFFSGAPLLWSSRLEKAMAPHSSTLVWKIPWTEEPGGLQSMGSLRVRHDRATSPSLFTFTHWRRKWQSTPVFLPGESQGLGSLVGCCLWGRTESDTTEVTYQQQQFFKVPFIKCQSNYLYHQDP